ncbi:MAG: hypothetical protein IJE97_15385 [Thermoguttaceae bacterium]|nr:hypothetical protein [Thermoguttaceae bacterium]MBQ7111209.1 hypothetical protein [Thermoguttaceae bacterium]
MKKLSNVLKTRALQASAVVGVAVVSTGSAFAETTAGSVEFIDIGVDAGTIASTIGTTIGPWVLGAFGIAGTIFAVKFGWRLLRNFANRS